MDGDNDEAAWAEVTAERAFVRELDGGCTSPVAAFARVRDGKLNLMGLYYDPETGGYKKGTIQGDAENARELGITLAGQLRDAYRKGEII